MSYTASMINVFAKMFNCSTYLEIGVFEGKTFRAVDMPLKVAVDPAFRFDPAAYASEGHYYYSLPSDDFFASFPNMPDADAFRDEEGRILWDIIFIDGLHTYEQTLRDFENSLKFSHENTIWIMDDTVPSDPYSALDDQELALKLRKACGCIGGSWHGDVFKALLVIHDLYPGFSYCTVMDRGNPQTVLWQAPALESRTRRFLGGSEEIDALHYLTMFQHADLFMPVTLEKMFPLLGTSIDPVRAADKNAWEKLIYRKCVTQRELQLAEEMRLIGKK